MQPEAWHAPPGARIPNNPRFPVLINRRVDAASSVDAARALLAQYGWGGSWVNGVFGFHHFHSTSRSPAHAAGRCAT
jgi:uncharacterized protein YjlB